MTLSKINSLCVELSLADNFHLVLDNYTVVYICIHTYTYMYVCNNVQVNFVDLHVHVNSDEEHFQVTLPPQKMPTTITSLIMGLAYNSRNSHEHV